MGFYQSSSAFNYNNYKILFQPSSLISGLSTTNYTSFLDPRGLFASGMLPSNGFSYRIYHETNEFTSTDSNAAFLASVFNIGSVGAAGFQDLEFASFTTRDAMTFFLGSDHIDVSTANMAYSGNVLTLPGNIYRCYYAGATPLVSPGDNVGEDLALAIANARKNPNNLVLGTQLSSGAASDVLAYSNALNALGGAQSSLFVDTASNQVILKKGSPKPAYVSYTTVDTPLFRDVVTLKGSVQAISISVINGDLIQDASPTNIPYSFILRYAWVNLNPNPKSPPQYGWRLAQSFGYNLPNLLQSVGAPGLTSNQQSQSAAAFEAQGYVYNLNDPSPDTTTDVFCQPAKKAYSYGYALAKMQKGNPLYDPTFAGLIVNYDITSGPINGLTEFFTVGPAVGSVVSNGLWSGDLLDTYGYTSPKLLSNLNQNARLGWEYALWQTSGFPAVSVPSKTIILASTQATSVGISISYDCCTHYTSVFDITNTSGGTLVVEKTFEDILWDRATNPLPTSILKGFSVGETIYRSIGRSAVIPVQTDLNATFNDNGAVTFGSTQSSSSGAIPTMINIGLPDSKNTGTTYVDLSLYASSDASGTPVYEAAIPVVNYPGAQILLGLPGFEFGSYASKAGATLLNVFGIPNSSPLAPALSGNSKSADPSQFQLAYVTASTYPINAISISSVGDCVTGYIFLAIENTNRIDLGVREVRNQPFLLIRDVCLRVADNFSTSPSATNIPPAGAPVLVADGATKNLYLFYIYKSSILVKKIPMEILVGQKTDPTTNLYSATTEASIITQLHKLTAQLIYNGYTAAGGLSADFQYQSIAPAIPDPTAVAITTSSQIQGYCGAIDSSGYLYCFVCLTVNNSNVFYIKRSPNEGNTWYDIIPGGYNPIPNVSLNIVNNVATPIANNNDNVNAAINMAMPQISYPACYYDNISLNMLFFFFYGNTLMFQIIPIDNLKKKSSTANAASLSLIRISALWGPVTQDIIQRGIFPNFSEGDITLTQSTSATLETVSPQRVTCVITSEGYYRVWYKNDSLYLRSLISLDQGANWLTENQFLTKA